MRIEQQKSRGVNTTVAGAYRSSGCLRRVWECAIWTAVAAFTIRRVVSRLFSEPLPWANAVAQIKRAS